MKMLLDECVPWPLHQLLEGHVCTTSQTRGWSGMKNGDLLRLAEAEFDEVVLQETADNFLQ
jgi:predicted nuclease of predicted toxin-antitoxin system